MDWTEEVVQEQPSEHSEPDATRSGSRVATYAVVALLLVGSVGGLGFYLGHDVAAPSKTAVRLPINRNGNFPSFGFGGFPRITPQFPSGTTTPKVNAASAKIAKKVDPGLVDITTNLSYQSSTAEGTGMVLSSNGLVLTNNHVIEGATSITARDVATGATYKANVVGYDVAADIAVLQLQNASGLAKVSIGTSGSLSTGEKIIGIGNAGGVGGTPSYASGSITALDQSITAGDSQSATGEEKLTGLIAVNAAIEPGDSGGPLVNAKGKVVGIDVAGSASSSFGYEQSSTLTQGYAIPISSAISIAKAIENGNASSTIHIGSTGFLGIEIEPTLSGQSSSAAGVTIAATVPGTPAAQSALSAGDVITSINGTSVATTTALQEVVGKLQPGDPIQISYVNQSGTNATLSLKLGSGPPL
jgi:S1-C subfamily serine protease